MKCNPASLLSLNSCTNEMLFIRWLMNRPCAVETIFKPSIWHWFVPAAELEEEEELIHEKIVEAAKWSAVMQYVSAAVASLKTRRCVSLTAWCVKRRSDKHGAAVVAATRWITLGFTLECRNEAWLKVTDSLMWILHSEIGRKMASGLNSIYSNRKGRNSAFIQHKSEGRCQSVLKWTSKRNKLSE